MTDIYNMDSLKLKRTLDLLYGRDKATTLNTAILNFLSDLELSDTQSKLVSSRQNAVRERAENAALIDVDDSRLIGSYARDTQIKSLNAKDIIDVDCLLMLKSTENNLRKYWHNGDGGRKLLTDLFNTLDGHQGLTVKIDSPAVTLLWNDLKMEIVPAFHRVEGGFLIPASSWWNNDWQATSPLVDAKLLTDLNAKTNQEFKPMVKMLKSWNRNFGKLIGSFPLETVCYHSIGSSYQNFDFELPHFFKTLRELNGQTIDAPSKVGRKVSIQLTQQQVTLISQCEQIVRESILLATNGRHTEAIAKMSLVFGKPFQGA